ncbi:MAG: HEAT repeat protein [Bacteroidia bacterium]|jgi:HEAT repeat protein
MAKISKTNRASVIKDLKSNDETVALKAIEKVKKGGDVSYMTELLDALTATTEAGIESSISQLLFDLKDKEAIEELVNQLVNPAYDDIRVIMLSACWQSGIDTSHRLPDFVTVVSTGSYMECLEVLTIIENWEDFSNQETLDLELLRLRSLLSESDKPENDEMVFSIIEVLELFIVQ